MREEWKAVSPPKFKKDWVGKYLNPLKERKRGSQERGGIVPPEGTLLRIDRRLNAQETMHGPLDVACWGKIRILSCSWYCGACGARHGCYIPESWIEDGHAVFVEKESRVGA